MGKMRKSPAIFALCFLVGWMSLLLGGWTDGQAQTTKEAQPKVALPKVINLATHPVGSLLNSFGNGMATVLSSHLPTVVKVMPTTGPTEWLPMIASGEVDAGILNNWDAVNGRYGREEYKAATAGKGSPILLLCSGTLIRRYYDVRDLRNKERK
jgi:hypothetical protein